MAENSESIPQLEEGSSTDAPEQSEIDVQHSEKSTTEICKGDTGTVTARSSANMDDILGPLSAKEIKEINILLRDISLLCQRPIMHNCLHFIPPRDVSDRVRNIATTSHFSSLRCSLMTFSMQEAITVGKKRRDEALQIAKVAKSKKAAIYRALADKYDAAIKLAIRRIHQLEVAAESAESAAIAAQSAVSQMAKVSDEIYNATSRVFAVQRTGNAAHKANVLACKTLYVSLKTMRTCWEDLDPELIEKAGLPTKKGREKQSERKQEKSRSLNASIVLNSFIVSVLIANARSRTIPLPYFSLRFALEAIGVGHLLYKTGKFCSEKLRVWEIEAKIANFNERLLTLDVIFGKYNAIPGESDIELNEPNPQDPMELAS